MSLNGYRSISCEISSSTLSQRIEETIDLQKIFEFHSIESSNVTIERSQFSWSPPCSDLSEEN